MRDLFMALPIGHPYLDRLNLAILTLLENDEMNRLRIKWWNLE